MADGIAKAEKIARIIRRAAEKATRESMIDLQGRAQRLAPIETGDLRASAQWAVKAMPDGSIVGGVAFPLPYAAAQHEGVDFNHPRGGEAKYLERPLKENADRYSKHVSNTIKRELGRAR